MSDLIQHVFAVRMELDHLEISGPQYVTREVICNEGGPPTGARGAPDRMGVAWYAVPELIANGTIEVIEAT